LAHEELRNTQSSLKQSQDTVKKLEKNISEKESRILSVEEALGKTIKELEMRVKHYVVIKNKNAFNVFSNTENKPSYSDYSLFCLSLENFLAFGRQWARK